MKSHNTLSSLHSKKNRLEISLLIFVLLGSFGFSNILVQSSTDEKRMAKANGHKVLLLNGKSVQLPLIYHPTTLHQKEVFQKDSLVSNVYSEYWNNRTFNAYLMKFPEFPIELNFTDTIFSAPVERDMVITSRYGWRRGRAHRGIDIDLQIGDKVKTLLGGKVRYARYLNGYGNTVVVRHENGLETVYAHLSKFSVQENDMVIKGQEIGLGGVSGNTRGSHLHLETRYFGKAINPEYLFSFEKNTKVNANYIVVTKKWMNPRNFNSTRKTNIEVLTSLEEVKTAKSVEPQKVYVVKKGDTLSRIANQHNIAISEICKINSIRETAVLNIGQELLIY